MHTESATPDLTVGVKWHVAERTDVGSLGTMDPLHGCACLARAIYESWGIGEDDGSCRRRSFAASVSLLTFVADRACLAAAPHPPNVFPP